MKDNSPTSERRSGRTNTLPDIKELTLRALVRAGWPREHAQAVRDYGDPRQRLRLADGTVVVAQYVPPLPPRERLEAKFERLFAEHVGNPVHDRAKEALDCELGNIGPGLPDAVLSAYYSDPYLDRAVEAFSNPPDPEVEAEWATWISGAWKAFCNALDWPLRLAVHGESPDKKRPAIDAKDAETGRFVGFDPDLYAADRSDALDLLALSSAVDEVGDACSDLEYEAARLMAPHIAAGESVSNAAQHAADESEWTEGPDEFRDAWYRAQAKAKELRDAS